MTDLRTAAQQALEAMEREAEYYLQEHSEYNEVLLPAIAALKDALAEEALQRLTDVQQEIEAALAQTTQSKLAAAGFTARDTRLECDECRKKFTRQMLPIHKCSALAEPVAWMVYTLDGKSVCVTDNPADFTDEHRVLPLFTSPPQRKPLTEEEIHDCFQQRNKDKVTERRMITRAVEAAHGIKEET